MPPTDATVEFAPLQFRSDADIPVLVVPRARSFEELRDHVRAVFPEHRERIGDSTLRLDLQDRPIVLFDLRRLISLFRDEFQVEITGLYVRNDVVHKFAERELKLRLFVMDFCEETTAELTSSPMSAPPVALTALAAELPHLANNPSAPPESEPPSDPLCEETQEPDATAPTPSELVATEASAPAVAVSPEPVVEPGRRSLVVQRTLRSGTAIKFDGDVTVMGDVNPGAEIVAAGNIFVLGALKGVAHAGCTGDEGAFILGFDLKPTQIRIGRRIAITPARADQTRVDPEIARIQDDQIAIEPYRRR